MCGTETQLEEGWGISIQVVGFQAAPPLSVT